MGGSGVIRIRGARQHNLKNVDLELPRNQLIVFTGVSGSGKSSLAFDTIFAEGQRRYVESLSSYARQFLGQLDKPDVDAIEGLSPAISIDQKSTSHNPRSTVGTVTEIYDYLRLLFGRAGVPHCPVCDHNISPQTVDQIADQILHFSEGTRFQLLAPIVKGKKGTHQKVLANISQNGFARVRVNGKVYPLAEVPKLDKNHNHRLEIVVDRLVLKPDLQTRLIDSLTTCLKHGEGVVMVSIQEGENWRDVVFSENFACPEHGAVMSELSPRLFSFNSPYGACPECHGLGFLRRFSAELVIPDPKLPLYQAIAPWSDKPHDYYLSLLHSLGLTYGFALPTPWCQLTPEQQEIILNGAEEPIWVEGDSLYQSNRGFWKKYEGVLGILERQYREAGSELVQQKLDQYRLDSPCPVCHGARLKPEALAVRLGGYRITDLTQISVQECLYLLDRLELTPRQAQIAHLVLKEIRARLQFLLDVGLDYLTLDRAAMTLSGGEAQRIRLATQIGSGLTGVLYVLDEPSIGLHQRDNGRLLTTLKRLRDLGNTLIVVEHDEETITSADHLVDIGPGAGVHGGQIVVQGNLPKLLAHPDSLTGAYLSRRKEIFTPTQRRTGNGKTLRLKDAHRHNLQHIDVAIPLGMFVCVTGVSGSGKSTLVNELLHPALSHHFGQKIPFPSELKAIHGLDALDKVIVIDQSPIGRTPRSNSATYTGTFDAIRALFAETPAAKARGYKAGHFSFNLKGGRCEACGGQGVNVIEMNFLPNVYVQCDVCQGKRYSRETLEVKYKGQSIADVLEMTVEEACGFFDAIPQAVNRLQTLVDVGLGYIRLGQTAPTLSGGEAQRIKLATELSRRATGKTLYLIDEPTTGLSFYDVHRLVDIIQRLVDKGNTVLVIEHNLDVIRCCDWVIDLGPEGGHRGGQMVAVGTPEQVAAHPHSHTGRYLKTVLAHHPPPKFTANTPA
ncbi:excinuclease ABC subunit A [Gloeomargarita lithophora Alchichica-D10]|uniref:UvrABC system protein A n=1 Tax=Gloeomargarita lithophora Alchichica-D10 TaxID=1188229 RepID=A0A1J0ABT6_9CYAN|nr:excinuclease ABC subunit UvrA [Gloeomargarita lithophora]APB33394.1 excinuclease ABC subunit A [Gloeomargarita lithophora Alchichica-D10]